MVNIDTLNSTCTWDEPNLEFIVTIKGSSDAAVVTVQMQAPDCIPTVMTTSFVDVADGKWEKEYHVPPPDLGRIRVRAWVGEDDRDPPKNAEGLVGFYQAVMTTEGLVGFDEPAQYHPVW